MNIQVPKGTEEEEEEDLFKALTEVMTAENVPSSEKDDVVNSLKDLVATKVITHQASLIFLFCNLQTF